MASSDERAPDALVLGGGGVLGEAWLSAVLAGIEHAGGFDARDCRRFLGTSAGSIVAASLVAGIDPGARLELTRPAAAAVGTEWAQDAAAGGQGGALAAALELGGVAARPLAALALSSSATGGALVRRAMLRRVPEGTRSLEQLRGMIERERVGFDGRLLVTAVELESGRRVVFGSPGAPSCTVADAVLASCAIPGVFAPVRIGGRSYVDGGAWSPTNMDALEVPRGSRVLCLNPTGSLRPSTRALAGALGPISRTIGAGEALALRHRGVEVETINPDPASARAMGVNLMDPRRRAGVIAAGHAQGLRLGQAVGLAA
jgi:NTE family protein